ncbi:LysR family transcriptional regulator [Undibacterium sp. Ji22W]|uniref:LysR family transcriptional regulator n=1 Tax=Undibacterium sp. Ji22W TaxID=3413038 RepID=UPI003BF15E08
MPTPDFNLLITLDAVLTEGSVAKAARRLQLSPSAMSRALARLREATGDPLLVRAGRGLVATPRALALREQVSHLVQAAEAVLRPVSAPDLGQLKRTFTLRSSEGFAENFGAEIIRRVHAQAPNVRLCFMPKPDKDSASLRDGTVDLETGVIDDNMSPELRTQALFKDRFVGVMRADHPLLLSTVKSKKTGEVSITLPRYLASQHIGISRKGIISGPVDSTLQKLGVERNIKTIAGGFSTALALARATDLIASVPARHTGDLRNGMHSFALPFSVPEISIALIWHPRMQADPAHRWLRELVRASCEVA